MKKGLHFQNECAIIGKVFERNTFAPVAQLDRVPGYEPVGREFESLRARQKPAYPLGWAGFLCIGELRGSGRLMK